MKKSSLPTLLVLSVLMLWSTAFTLPENVGLEATYGVSESNPAHIELQLHSDFSFTYQDLSNAENPTEVRGTYQLKNNKVVLAATDSEIRFHDHWKITDSGMAAKSRKGMTFYRLCKK